MTFSIIVVLSKGIEDQNRQDIFQVCFNGLINQDYPKESYEIILVDSGSEINESAVADLKTKARSLGVAVYFVQPKLGNIGPARSRNIGLKAVSEGQTGIRSEAVAFTDDDTLVPADWLSRLDGAYKNFPEASGVGGLTLPSDDLKKKNIFAFYDDFIYRKYPQSQGQSTSLEQHPVFSGNISYNRAVLEKVGGFDKTYKPYIYGEDADLKERVVKNGGFLVFVNSINIHLASYSLGRFIKQQESRGGGILKYRLKHNLKFPGRLELILRLILTPVVLPLYLRKNHGRLKIGLLETFAYLFRQVGKLKYYQEFRIQNSEFRKENTRKKNLMFGDHTPVIGGAQLALLRHLRYLDKSRFSIAVVTSGNYPGFNDRLREIDLVKTYRVGFPHLKNYNPFSLFRFLWLLIKLTVIVLKERSQILVANTERAFYAFFLVSILLNRKLFVIVRDFEYSKILLKLTAFKVSRFICVSKKIQSFYGFGPVQSSVVYVGSDIAERLKVLDGGDVAKIKAKLNVGEGGLVIGFAGRLISWKGPELLLNAFALLSSKHVGLRLIFLGDGPMKERLLNEVARLGIKEKVFFTGFIKDTAVWYKSFDIFVHASIKDEPFATVIIEAALAGLPIVATNTGGTPEFIENLINGLLVEPREDALVGGLEIFIANENLRKRLAEAAREKALNKFTEKQITQSLQEIYNTI